MKPGSKPRGQVALKWTPQFAYAIGLLTADGCLSKDGRHIDFTSKDVDQVVLFKKCLGLATIVGKKYSGIGNLYHHTQFGDVLFYEFLKNIGITPAKSKTISSVLMPKKYFLDFLRGYFDGDGCSYSYYDPVYPKSYRFYISFTSASPNFFTWLQCMMQQEVGVKGFLNYNSRKPTCVQLKYSKNEAVLLVKALYPSEKVPCLRRKYLKIMESMRIIEAGRDGVIGKRAAFRSQ